MGESKSSPRRIEAVEKRQQALRLRKAGVTYDRIAEQVGYVSKGTAHKAVMQELRALPRDDAAEVLTLEVERLDNMLAALWPAAVKGHVRSIETVIRVMERRARLLGLDAPAKMERGAEQGLSMIGEIMTAIRGADS